MPLMLDRAAQHFAAGVVHPPPAHVGLGFALVLPVIEPAADGVCQRRWHVDEDVPLVVRSACFEHQNLVLRVGAQTVGKRATSGAATHDDEVVHRCSMPDGYPQSHSSTRLTLTR